MDEINYYKYKYHDGDKIASNYIGNNDQVYSAVQAVNAELDSFGHVFKAFSWKDTLDIAAGGSNTSRIIHVFSLQHQPVAGHL